MKLGRVIGNLESTVKHPCYHNLKLMIVQPLDANSQPHGRTHPAVDTVGAGVGNLVLVVEEGKAAQALIDQKNIPIRTLIVGIVDQANRTKEKS
jgi:microcompartment protein CcmK/EutM